MKSNNYTFNTVYNHTIAISKGRTTKDIYRRFRTEAQLNFGLELDRCEAGYSQSSAAFEKQDGEASLKNMCRRFFAICEADSA